MQDSDLSKKQSEIEQYYDEYVARQSRVGVNKRHYSILKKLKTAGLKSTDTVLEIGCGIGTFTGLLLKEIRQGSVSAMDISSASIHYAKDHNTSKKVEYIHADASSYDFGDNKFDVIVLPDVLEHIPLDLHRQLFEKLSQVLKQDGFIFIHIPNPYYLEWCHQHRPDLLQVIDQPIYTDELIKNITPVNLYMHEIRTYTIWVRDGDYQYIVLKNKLILDFSMNMNERIGVIKNIKGKYNSLRTK